MRTVLVTTTIRVPRNLEAWRHSMREDDVVIVVGDRKTPDADVTEFLKTLPGDNRYMPPGAQLAWRMNGALEWNTIQRRNIGLLEAMKLRPDFIVTVDDDNWPVLDTHVDDIDRFLMHPADNPPDRVAAREAWFDPGQLLDPPTSHRGFPISQRERLSLDYPIADKEVVDKVGVLASLWIGDPDVDAVTRMSQGNRALQVERVIVHSVQLPLGTWAPFNSQATAYRTELAPLMMVWPGCGRFDDIWGSYLAQRVMQHLGWHVRIGHPIVSHERNEHDVFLDLEQEFMGMRYTDALVEVLRQIEFSSDNVYECLREAFGQVQANFRNLPHAAFRAFDPWLYDVASVTL